MNHRYWKKRALAAEARVEVLEAAIKFPLRRLIPPFPDVQEAYPYPVPDIPVFVLAPSQIVYNQFVYKVSKHVPEATKTVYLDSPEQLRGRGFFHLVILDGWEDHTKGEELGESLKLNSHWILGEYQVDPAKL